MSIKDKDKFSFKLVDLIKNYRIWILIVILLMSTIAINYHSVGQGVVINGVTTNSLAGKGGLNYNSNSNLMGLERINSVNGIEIRNISKYYTVIDGLKNSTSFKVVTNLNPKGYIIKLVGINYSKPIANQIGISVRKAPTSNIKLGIELEGGTRLILEPVKNLTNSQFALLISSLQNRLNIYGASGTKVNKLEDLFTGKKFVEVISSSSNKNEILQLLEKQGKFRADVGNQTAFTGEDVVHVFNDPQNARLQGCSQGQTKDYTCTYAFLIEINGHGATQFFNLTSKLFSKNGYLSKKVTFYLDNKNITSLNIASSFKYQKITNPQISVSGSPENTQAKAVVSAQKQMKFLQTILSTKSLPSNLKVVQSYSISSTLGTQLLNNALFVGLLAILIVSLTVSLRYKDPIVFVGIILTLISEIIIIFGVSAFMRLTIDLGAIGGIIASIGTGVDDQIIITDEQKRIKNRNISSRKRMKNAIYIIIISYFATLGAMIPLYFAGLKMLQGFAFMIIIGVTVGVVITRPAFAIYLRIMMTTRRDREYEEKD